MCLGGKKVLPILLSGLRSTGIHLSCISRRCAPTPLRCARGCWPAGPSARPADCEDSAGRTGRRWRHRWTSESSAGHFQEGRNHPEMTGSLEEEAEVRICTSISRMLPLYCSLFYHCNRPACSLLLIINIPVDAAISDNSLRRWHICNTPTGLTGLDLNA